MRVAHARAPLAFDIACLAGLGTLGVGFEFPAIAHTALTASIRLALTHPLLGQHPDGLDALADSDEAVFLPDGPTWRTTATLATLPSAFVRTNTLRPDIYTHRHVQIRALRIAFGVRSLGGCVNLFLGMPLQAT